MKLPSVTLIIPTFNEEEYLPALLTSIREQTHQPEAIIIADAHSTDQTRAIAKAFGAQVVDGGMPGAGRNAGARAATTDLLFFLDADAVFSHPEMLERCLKSMQRLHLEIATMDIHPSDGTVFDALLFRLYNRYVRTTVSVRPHASGAAILVTRALHDRIQGFDETITLAEDMDYAKRAAKKGKFGMLPRSCSVRTSIRRMERDGRLATMAKILVGEAHMVLLGPIRHKKIPYTFGYKKKK